LTLVKAAKDIGSGGDRLKVMLGADDKAAKLVKALTYQSFQYVSSIIPEVADTVIIMMPSAGDHAEGRLRLDILA
jgi:hypothetical protein